MEQLHVTNVSRTQINNNLPNEKVRWNDDFFSALTIEECERHFEEHYENNIDQFAETKDKLSLLRSCIELLNRLEHTAHNLFAGRVLIFLARVIPLFDQSGVNLRSEFSIRELPKCVAENLKQIGAQNAEKDKQLSQLIEQDIEEGETLSDEESNEATPQEDSDRIYERFWKIQQFLNQPNLLYDKNSWFTFRTHVDSFIYKLESKSASLKVWQLKDSYMTDSKSLSLQLNDINMRRCFLVQILIVLQYLELPVDTRPENFVLDKVQMSWSSTLTKRIYGLLDSMPNEEEGRNFVGLVRHVLKREEMWNRWKNEKCKEHKRILPDEEEEMVNMRGTYNKRRKISDELSSAKPYNMHVIGSQEMSRLWNMKPNQKFNTPDLAKYLNIPLEKQAESFKDPNYSFRVLRLLRKSPHFFRQTYEVIQSLDGYLKNVASKHSETSNQSSQVSNDITLNTSMNSNTTKVPAMSNHIENSISLDTNNQIREVKSKDSLSNTTSSSPEEVKMTTPNASPTAAMEVEDSTT